MKRIINMKSLDEIIDSIKQRPTDMLALARTVMAGERTFLGYIRTFVGFLAGGIVIVMYLDHPFLLFVGVLLILASINSGIVLKLSIYPPYILTFLVNISPSPY